MIQKRFLCKPKDNKIIPPEPIAKENKPDLTRTFSGYFQRPVAEKTYDRIFNYEKRTKDFNLEQENNKGKIRRNNKAYRDSIGRMFEEQGKLAKAQNISEKPCKDNYKILSSEAKKNVTERYYFDNNLNQW